MNTIRNTAIKGFALGIITGSAITSGAILLAAPAKAEPSVNSAERVVCLMLDTDPTFGGVVHAAAEIVQATGATAYQAGQFIAVSVADQCPEHQPLLDAFVKAYAPNTKTGGKIA